MNCCRLRRRFISPVRSPVTKQRNWGLYIDEQKRRRNPVKYLLWFVLILSVAASSQAASEHHGQVRMGEVPIPGAIVRATQGDKVARAITDAEGKYSIADMSDGTWTVQVEMLGFESTRGEVVVNSGASEAPSPVWNLTLLPIGDFKADGAPGFLSTSPALRLSQSRTDATANTTPRRNLAPIASSPEDLSERAADGLLINGTVSNGASTPFALPRALGNNRKGGRSL